MAVTNGLSRQPNAECSHQPGVQSGLRAGSRTRPGLRALLRRLQEAYEAAVLAVRPFLAPAQPGLESRPVQPDTRRRNLQRLTRSKERDQLILDGSEL